MFGKIFQKKSSFRFPDPENTASMVCSHVLYEQAPILYVSHDEDDGMWQFLCGSGDHQAEQAKVIALGEAARIDPSVNELYKMPLGVGATRKSVTDQWKAFKL